MNARAPRGRLGFAVMVGPDGKLPEAVLIGLKAAGYTGIEPNCYQPQHLKTIIERCRHVDLAIHALPPGRWMNVAQAPEDYERYTQRAFEVLSEGVALAAALDAPLIFGLIRGPSAISAAQAEAFLTTVIPRLVQTTPDLKILVEPIAADEAAWPHTIEQGARLLERLKLPNVKLLADSYHIVRGGQDLHIEQHRGLSAICIFAITQSRCQPKARRNTRRCMLQSCVCGRQKTWCYSEEQNHWTRRGVLRYALGVRSTPLRINQYALCSKLRAEYRSA